MSGGPDLTIADLFPADDVVAQWVYNLTALADDISIIMPPIQRAMEQENLRELLFFARLLFARIYEARRLVASHDETPEIQAFAQARLPHDDPMDYLLSIYRQTPGEDSSLVERTFGTFRHQAVHYMWPGREELAAMLAAASFLPARLVLTPEPARYEAQWVQAVSGMALFGDRSDPEWVSNFSKMNQLAGHIAGRWGMLSGVFLITHARLRGIDLADLHATEG